MRIWVNQLVELDASEVNAVVKQRLEDLIGVHLLNRDGYVVETEESHHNGDISHVVCRCPMNRLEVVKAAIKLRGLLFTR